MNLPPEASLDQCIKCNICTTGCPVSSATDLFPGPKAVGPQAGRFRQHPFPAGQAQPDLAVDYCSGCRVCNLICPTGVKIAEINARARAQMVAQGKFSLLRRVRNNLIARAELLGKFGGLVAPLANFALNAVPLRWGLEKTLGIARHAPLPAFSAQRFTTWFRRHPRPAHARRPVVYFHGCSTQYYEPRIGRAAVQVLEALGCEVIVPPQNCCGLPLLSNGEFAAARRYHASNVRHLAPYARQGIPIVGTSTSCTLTLKEEAPELLDMFDEETRLVAENTYDFNEFLLWLAAEGEFRLELGAIPFRNELIPQTEGHVRLPYHVPCQYRAHRLGSPGEEVLAWIPGLQVETSPAACCGIAGTYGYKVEKYAIAQQVGAPLFEFVQRFHSSGEDSQTLPAPLVICDSETCRWQITHATGVPAIHPVELLAAACGLPVEPPLASFLQPAPALNPERR